MGVARFRLARIQLLNGSLYTWLGAKVLSQFSLMAGISEASTYNRNLHVPFTLDSGRQANGSVDFRLAVLMMQYFRDFGPMFENGILSNYSLSCRTSRLSDPCLEGGRRRQRIGQRPLATRRGTELPDAPAGALRMNTIVIAWLSFDDNQTPLNQAEVNYSHMT